MALMYVKQNHNFKRNNYKHSNNTITKDDLAIPFKRPKLTQNGIEYMCLTIS